MTVSNNLRRFQMKSYHKTLNLCSGLKRTCLRSSATSGDMKRYFSSLHICSSTAENDWACLPGNRRRASWPDPRFLQFLPALLPSRVAYRCFFLQGWTLIQIELGKQQIDKRSHHYGRLCDKEPKVLPFIIARLMFFANKIQGVNNHLIRDL